MSNRQKMQHAQRSGGTRRSKDHSKRFGPGQRHVEARLRFTAIMEKTRIFAYYDYGDRGGLDRVRTFEVLTKECGPRQPVLPDLSRGDLLQVSKALKLLQATLKARVNSLGSGTCLFLGIMSLDQEGSARHKQMDQEHTPNRACHYAGS